MAHDLKYGTVHVEKDSAENPLNESNEPVFVLRARDTVAMQAISVYAGLAKDAGASREFLDGVAAVQLNFGDWREANREKVKVPD